MSKGGSVSAAASAVNFMRLNGQETTDLPLRILAQSDMIGAIIGRSGGTIKQITQQTKARIDVHREETSDQTDKVITINGTPKSCSAACFKIMQVIENEKFLLSNKGAHPNSNNNNNYQNSSGTNDGNNGESLIRPLDHMENFENNEITLRILAHNNLIGRLIGRNGASIKKIMELTSTKINISVNNLTDSTHERTITVVGNFEQVRQAEEVISSKLRAAYASDVNFTLQSINQPAYVYNNVPISYMQRPPYAQSSILTSLANSQTGNHAQTTPGHAIPRGLSSICPHPTGQMASSLYHNQSNYLPIYPNVAGVPPSAPGILSFIPTLETEKETVHIYIPTNTVGAIIGKSGSAIKEMISSSGASIKIAAVPSQPPVPLNKRSPSATSNNNTATHNSETNNSQPDSKGSQDNLAPNGQVQNNEIEIRNEPQHQNQKIQSDGVENSGSNANSAQASPLLTKSVSQESQQNSSSNHSQNARKTVTAADMASQTRKVTIIGVPDSQWTAQYLIFRKVSSELGKNDATLMVEVQIPSHLVGKIIGKAGLAVKQLQKQTRTTIRLFDNKSGSDDYPETSVQITGEFQNCHMAQRHIRNLIKEGLFASVRHNNNSKNQRGHSDTSNPVRTNAQQANFIDNSNDQYRGDEGVELNHCDTQNQSERLSEKVFQDSKNESDTKRVVANHGQACVSSNDLCNDANQTEYSARAES